MIARRRHDCNDPDAAHALDRTPKSPHITPYFWALVLLSGAVGESFVASLTAIAPRGAVGVVLAAGLVGGLIAQLRSRRYSPFGYWPLMVLLAALATTAGDLVIGLSRAWQFVVLGALVSVLIVSCASPSTRSSLAGPCNSGGAEVAHWSAIAVSFTAAGLIGDIASEYLRWTPLPRQTLLVAGSLAVGALIMLGAKRHPLHPVAIVATLTLGTYVGDAMQFSRDLGGVGLGAQRTTLLLLAALLMIVSHLYDGHQDQPWSPRRPAPPQP